VHEIGGTGLNGFDGQFQVVRSVNTLMPLPSGSF